jgi:hypothetical protein
MKFRGPQALNDTFEIVITKSFENPQKISKTQFVRFQKCLLAAVREGAMKSSSTGHAPHAKYVGLLSLSPNICVSFIPVHLRLFPPSRRPTRTCTDSAFRSLYANGCRF